MSIIKRDRARAAPYTRDQVVVVGGCGIDIQGRAKLHPKDSTPGHIAYSVGGVAHNIAENLAYLDIPVSLISAVGADPFGEYILRKTAASGINVSGMLVNSDYPTGSYLSLMNEQGDMVNAISSMDVIYTLSDNLQWIETRISTARIVVIDTNLSAQTITAICNLCHPGTILLAEPVSTIKILRLLPVLERLSVITPNKIEAEALYNYTHQQRTFTPGVEELAEWFRSEGIDNILITLGADGVYHQDADTRRHYTPIVPRSSVSTTGAGDAFAAGIVYGYWHSYDIRRIIAAGLAMAALAVESEAAVNPHLTRQSVEKLCAAY